MKYLLAFILACAVSAGASEYRYRIPQDGLIAYWVALENVATSSTAANTEKWYDRSGSGNNITYGSTNSTPNYVVGGYGVTRTTTGSTVGSGAWQVVNTVIPLVGNFTIGAWFRTNSSTSGSLYNTMFMGGTQYGVNRHLHLYTATDTSASGGVLAVYAYQPTADTERKGTVKVTDGNWHLCILAVTNQTAQFYVDGVADGAEFSFSNTNSATSFIDKVGCGTGSPSTYRYPLKGNLFSAFVYSRALSPAEIYKIYINTMRK